MVLVVNKGAYRCDERKINYFTQDVKGIFVGDQQKTPALPRQDRRIKTKRKTNFKQVFYTIVKTTMSTFCSLKSRDKHFLTSKRQTLLAYSSALIWAFNCTGISCSRPLRRIVRLTMSPTRARPMISCSSGTDLIGFSFTAITISFSNSPAY